MEIKIESLQPIEGNEFMLTTVVDLPDASNYELKPGRNEGNQTFVDAIVTDGDFSGATARTLTVVQGEGIKSLVTILYGKSGIELDRKEISFPTNGEHVG